MSDVLFSAEEAEARIKSKLQENFSVSLKISRSAAMYSFHAYMIVEVEAR